MKYWIAVASKEHVLKGVSEGIAQVCHGKLNPLKQMTAGDWIVYYSPVEYFGQNIPCRKFTAIGRVKPGEPYEYPMSETFIPWRRDILFLPAQEIAIQPLIPKLSFIVNQQRWGFPFRRGCFAVSLEDFSLIATAMDIAL